MFGMGEKKETTDSEDKKPSAWNDSLASSIAEARAKLTKGKKRDSNDETGTTKPTSGGRISSADAEKIRAMFDPKAWKTLVKTPFVLGTVLTGRKCWELEKEEEDTLATTTAASAEYFLQSDPKWVCLTICMFNWSVILTSKFLANAKETHNEQVLLREENGNQPSQ